MATVADDVLKEQQQQAKRLLDDVDLATRRAEETASRRNEASRWLRKMVGGAAAGAAKDLPEEPSEETFRKGLRNGMVLCNALNKVVPGAVPKVVEIPSDSVIVPDGAALSAYQYFENVRNFLDALQEMGLPTFEASDFEQGGKSSRVVNCVLALKSYHEKKQTGGTGSWRHGGCGPLRSMSSGKHFVLRNSEPFMNSFPRAQSMDDKFREVSSSEEENEAEDSAIGSIEMNASHSLNSFVRAALSDKKPEEIPSIVEALLKRVMEEYEHRRSSSESDLVRGSAKAVDVPCTSGNFAKVEMEENVGVVKEMALRKLAILDQQQKCIQELKYNLKTTKTGMDYMKMQYAEEFNNIGKHMQVLAREASGYHKVLEENRKLYNQVQDLKGNIRVYCRVRPFHPAQSNKTSSVVGIDDGNITVMFPMKYVKDGKKSFTFNRIFGPSASQGELFEDTQPLIRSVLDGYNVCIFAYGQTGSGKTFTMSGPKDADEQSHGVNYRALGDLFHLLEQRKDAFHYEIAVQMIEIYNEQVRDLLAADGVNKRLEIRNSAQNGLNVPDASLVPVSSTSEVIELMNTGHRNRAVGATALNDRSSRSHSCLTVHVQGRDLASGAILRGCMNLVDLAGSERVDKSEVKGDRLKEAQHINKSLSALGDVISSLAQKNSHVPYRNSKLTQLLQDSLGGQAKTLMFVHISPEVDAIGETISTLKFAERVATVELGAARINKEDGEVRELKEQIVSLKAALARKEEEQDCFPNTMSSTTPDIITRKTACSSPNGVDEGDKGGSFLINQRQPMEEVGNIERCEISVPKQKCQSFQDLQQLLMAADSPHWPGSHKKQQHKTLGSDDDLMRGLCWEGDERSLFDSAAPTDDSDDLDIETSDSSEAAADLQWRQLSYSKAAGGSTNGGGGGASRIKIPQVKSMKSPESTTRNSSISRIPTPSKKASNGSAARTPGRNGSLLPGFDRRRLSQSVVGKVGNVK